MTITNYMNKNAGILSGVNSLLNKVPKGAVTALKKKVKKGVKSIKNKAEQYVENNKPDSDKTLMKDMSKNLESGKGETEKIVEKHTKTEKENKAKEALKSKAKKKKQSLTGLAIRAGHTVLDKANWKTPAIGLGLYGGYRLVKHLADKSKHKRKMEEYAAEERLRKGASDMNFLKMAASKKEEKKESLKDKLKNKLKSGAKGLLKKIKDSKIVDKAKEKGVEVLGKAKEKSKSLVEKMKAGASKMSEKMKEKGKDIKSKSKKWAIKKLDAVSKEDHDSYKSQSAQREAMLRSQLTAMQMDASQKKKDEEKREN